MNPEVKKMWVEALRSGGYKQGACFLNGTQGFCCLGVLCDLHAITTGGEWADQSYKSANPKRYGGSDSLLPDSVKEWSGLKDRFGDEVLINGERAVLSKHNDRGCTFAEIANAIEEQL